MTMTWKGSTMRRYRTARDLTKIPASINHHSNVHVRLAADHMAQALLDARKGDLLGMLAGILNAADMAKRVDFRNPKESR